MSDRDRPAAGWHPDPAGRFLLRWHDGEGWSSEVSDGWGALVDRSAAPPGPGRPLHALLIGLTPVIALLVLVAFAVRA